MARMKKIKEGYTIPEEDRAEYYMLVQRANRRMKSALKYIDKHNISTQNARRTLVFNYDDQTNWAGKKSVFSRAVRFDSKQDYEATIRHLNKWGEKTARGQRWERHPERVKADYISSIKQTMIDTAVHYSIPLKNGKLPKELIDKLNNLTYDQIANFYGSSDPSEDLMIQELRTDGDIEVGDSESFVRFFESRVAELKKFIK